MVVASFASVFMGLVVPIIILQCNVFVVVAAAAAANRHDNHNEMKTTESFMDAMEGYHGRRHLSKSDFVRLVGCHTINNPPLVSTSLIDYGCYCGSPDPDAILFKGPCNRGTPCDKIDECCQVHDNDWTSPPAPNDCDCATQDYNWKCMAIANTDPQRYTASCDAQNTQPANQVCAKYCCDVDLKFANCLLANKAAYNGANANKSDPGAKGCKPCFDQPKEHEDPNEHGTCDTAPCCSDCLCCGPGTYWDGTTCVIGQSGIGNPNEDPCWDYYGEDKCIDTMCMEERCCPEGTQLARWPGRDDVCFCHPGFDPSTVTTTGIVV